MAEATYVRNSTQTIDYVAGATIAAGQVVIAGSLVGVAHEPIANGDTGSLSIDGEYDFAKTATVTFAVGDPLYFDESANTVGTTNTDALIGYCTRATTSGSDAVVRGVLAQPIDPTD